MSGADIDQVSAWRRDARRVREIQAEVQRLRRIEEAASAFVGSERAAAARVPGRADNQ